MNWDRIEGNWKQFKGKVKQKWAKITDDDLENIDGKRDELIGKVPAHVMSASRADTVPGTGHL